MIHFPFDRLRRELKIGAMGKTNLLGPLCGEILQNLIQNQTNSLGAPTDGLTHQMDTLSITFLLISLEGTRIITIFVPFSKQHPVNAVLQYTSVVIDGIKGRGPIYRKGVLDALCLTHRNLAVPN